MNSDGALHIATVVSRSAEKTQLLRADWDPHESGQWTFATPETLGERSVDSPPLEILGDVLGDAVWQLGADGSARRLSR